MHSNQTVRKIQCYTCNNKNRLENLNYSLNLKPVIGVCKPKYLTLLPKKKKHFLYSSQKKFLDFFFKVQNGKDKNSKFSRIY